MQLFNFLQAGLSQLEVKNTKIHLASWNGKDKPIDIFLKGEFEQWQSWQSKRNFEREYILALIQLDAGDKWLFAGVYKVKGSKYIQDEKPHYNYQTQELDELKPYVGRLVIKFKRVGRQSYLVAENWADKMLVEEMLPTAITVAEFAGYNNTCIPKATLDLIIRQNIASWRAALANVSGVYLITDTNTGKLYVGSATGNEGIWQRWTDYSDNGHGGNKRLEQLLQDKGEEHAVHFQYTILEIADTHTSPEEVKARESYWKQVLCSKEYGYNDN